MGKALSTVNWKKYLDINNGNPQVKRFLESRGDDVLWQISQNIQRANRKNRESLVMVIHENAPAAILIEKKDYMDVLELSLKWFEKREYYERCSGIVEIKNDLINKTSQLKSNKDTSNIQKTII